jgi:type II secretory pathway component PulL
MTFVCRRFAPWFVLTAALFVSAVSTPAFAYSQEQEQACTPDAMRLCGNFIPDVSRVTTCMIQKKSQLSPQCRRVFRPAPGASRRSKKPVRA